MRKFFALAVIATALTVGSVAKATVFIDVTLQSPGSQLFDITVSVTDATRVGGIALLANPNVTALTLNAANTGIDPLLSGMMIDVLGDGTTNAIGIKNTAAGVAIAFGPAPVLIGTLTIVNTTCNTPFPSCANPDIRPGDELYGYTASRDDATASPIIDTVVREHTAFPEPASVVLLGLALAFKLVQYVVGRALASAPSRRSSRTPRDPRCAAPAAPRRGPTRSRARAPAR